MKSNFGENDAKNLLNDVFKIACGTFEFVNDINFQSENRRVLQSGNARTINYRLGRTEERYDKSIRLCDDISEIVSNIKSQRESVVAPIMQRTTQEKYTVCSTCYTSVTVSVPYQEYYWQAPYIPPVKCYDCYRLTKLTDLILLYAAIKKAQEKTVDNTIEKSVEWLANQFGNDANEIKKLYYAERRQRTGGDWV